MFPRPRVETFFGPVSSIDSFRPIVFSLFSIKNLKIIILICFENETTSETRDHRGLERCISFKNNKMHLPLFLCLYESFWKGFESDQRRLTLLVIKCVCLSGAS